MEVNRQLTGVTSQFSDKEGITTTGWQSDQYLAFARMLSVYFGLLDDYSDVVDNNKIVALQQVFVLWLMLLSALFTSDTCNSRLVDDCVRLFLSACIHYGETTKKNISRNGFHSSCIRRWQPMLSFSRHPNNQGYIYPPPP
jgi:hypothetical protein